MNKKKKIDSRKVILRKLKDCPENPRLKTKIVCVAVLSIAAILVVPGICLGIAHTETKTWDPVLPERGEPRIWPDYRMVTPQEFPIFSDEVPEKVQPVVPSCSGYLSGVVLQ